MRRSIVASTRAASRHRTTATGDATAATAATKTTAVRSRGSITCASAKANTHSL